MKSVSRNLVLATSVLALSACGADDIASPGTGGNVIINNPTPAPTNTPPPGQGTTAVAAAECPFIEDPQGLTNRGILSGPSGEYRLCALPSRFNRDTTLRYTGADEAVIYLIDGQVDVGADGGPTADGSDGLNDTNVELRIEPGVVLVGLDASYLNVNRGNQIFADGTRDRPIIFTSQENVRGENTDTSSGDWGGLIINGRAPITDCISNTATPGTADCQRETEGTLTPPLYGGNDPDDDSGSVSFVQIRYSGTVLANGDELQALTTGGVGSETNFENIMSFNSSDDGVEFFGGRVNMKGLVVVGAEDDSIDTDTGVKANLQYVVVAQRDVADTIIEADSSNLIEEQTPRQNTRISNGTFIQRRVNDQAIRIRGRADYTIVNSILVDASGGPTECLRIDTPATLSRAADASIDEAGPVRFESFVLDCDVPFRDGSDGVTAAQVEAVFNAGSNNNANFTNTLMMGYLSGTNEDAVPVFDPTQLSSFFDDVDFIGAAQVGDNRFEGWTCDSSTLTFGDNTGPCTAIPVYEGT
jgi:hypothetical protein